MKLDAVLFPTDFSDASELAGAVARDIARDSGATLHVVHVVPPVTDPADSAARLAEIGQRLGDGVRVETALLSGRIARHIVSYARDHRVGLIVLGPHGRTGLSRAILGSVAEAVVRLARCLVLTVPASVVPEEPGAVEDGVPPMARCVVCMAETADLVCETCRIRIRAAELERRRLDEHPGRRGQPT